MQYLFTTYLILLILFYKYTAKYIDLLLLAFIVFVISMYISYIYPHKYIVQFFGTEYEYSGYNLIYPDIIHVLLLIIAFFITKNTDIYKILVSIFIVFTYILCINAEKLYGVPKETLYKLGCYAILIYLCYYIYIKN